MKNVIHEIKTSEDGVNNRVDIAKVQVSKYEDRVEKIQKA